VTLSITTVSKARTINIEVEASPEADMKQLPITTQAILKGLFLDPIGLVSKYLPPYLSPPVRDRQKFGGKGIDMGRSEKGTSQRKGRHERLPPAESAGEISSSLSSLSIDSNGKSSFPVPLAMWVWHHS
jgi:hypothetical protein